MDNGVSALYYDKTLLVYRLVVRYWLELVLGYYRLVVGLGYGFGY